MRRLLKAPVLLCGLLMSAALAAATPATAPHSSTPALAFRIDEGQNLNSFLRDGPVAAHLLLRSGNDPRVLVAFPAGNGGIGLWFESTTAPVAWTLVTPPRPVSTLDARRRPLHGIEFEVAAQARELRPRAAVLSSVRVLRDYELQRTAPPEVMVAPKASPGLISWERDRLDGAAGFRLSIEAQAGTRVSATRFEAGTPTIRLRIRALSGEEPLQPLDAPFTARAASDPRARQVLAFLSYRDKLLAGSWRFNTYFGRDTLISATLLAPVLEPRAMEGAIDSVLDRLAPNGEVAHEEDIGEFAVLRNSREGRGRIATPIYDYGMVDDDFLLAPLVARWLLDDARGNARAREFLGGRSAHAERRGAALVRNLAWLVERTAAFAADPRAANLVGIKAGRMTGNWRDSEQGLGRGRYAYDINAALVPAALEAAARLLESRLLDDFLDAAGRHVLTQAREQARIWTMRAPSLFAVDIPAARARTEVAAYAKEVGVDAERALRALDDNPVRLHALSLDEQGRAIAVLNSDESFRLMFTEPAADEIARCIESILRPFPAGLVTDAGLVVANPAFADSALRGEFTRFAYHGTVIWSWQQALLAAGIDRQLRRTDLPTPVRTQLQAARENLWAVIDRAASVRTSELWSWSYSGGRYRIEPFGRPGAHVDESNAAQLWSTVFLGLAR